jgi:2-oxoglutarate ferredoxin oxidoreductase subunit delta
VKTTASADAACGTPMAKKRAREIRVNTRWCKACGICVAFCQPQVLRSGPDGIPQIVDLDACTLCMLCELRCPDFAIIVEAQTEEVSTARAPAAVDAG